MEQYVFFSLLSLIYDYEENITYNGSDNRHGYECLGTV